MFGKPKPVAPGLVWEKLKKDEVFHSAQSFRAKVPGGWFVSVQAHTGVGVTFYPDPEHQWDGNTLP